MCSFFTVPWCLAVCLLGAALAAFEREDVQLVKGMHGEEEAIVNAYHWGFWSCLLLQHKLVSPDWQYSCAGKEAEHIQGVSGSLAGSELLTTTPYYLNDPQFLVYEVGSSVPY